MRYEFLPPYSPDLNPIELAFSAMKYHLKRNGDYARMAMNELGVAEVERTLRDAIFQTRIQDCEGWYHHCGYLQ